MDMNQAASELKKALIDNDEFNPEVNNAFQQFAQALSEQTPETVDSELLNFISLVRSFDQQRGRMVSLMCGNLVENGFPVDKAAEYYVGFYGEMVDKVYPFFRNFLEQANKTIDPDSEDASDKMSTLFEELSNEVTDNSVHEAIEGLTVFFPCAIAMFSSDKKPFYDAKQRLDDKVAVIGQYNDGCYWLAKLFTTFFDEPVVVIDIDNKQGFTGTISGINDNYQFQHLLMMIPELNDKITLTEEQMDTVEGYGKQSLDSTIVSKWNMYNANLLTKDNWTELINTDTPQKALNYRDAWIWQEGAPDEIPVYKGRRMVLLGKSPVQRSTRAQRTFRNLKASIEIEKMLTPGEINEWLGLED